MKSVLWKVYVRELITLAKRIIDVLDRDLIACFGTKIIEELSNALLAIRICPEWIDDPDLSQVHSGGESSRLFVPRNEFYVLYSAALDVL